MPYYTFLDVMIKLKGKRGIINVMLLPPKNHWA